MDVLEAGRLLTDGYALRILAAVSYKSKGAQEVSEEYNIPIAACYRRIKELEKAGVRPIMRRVAVGQPALAGQRRLV